MRPCNVPQPAGWRCTRGYHEGGSCALIEVAAEPNATPLNPLGDLIHKALSDVLQAYDRSMPSRWVLVCESLEEDGTTKTWDVCNEGLSGWESLGMFEFGSQVIKARVTAAEVRGSEE
jgi:hypothetical protein